MVLDACNDRLCLRFVVLELGLDILPLTFEELDLSLVLISLLLLLVNCCFVLSDLFSLQCLQLSDLILFFSTNTCRQ